MAKSAGYSGTPLVKKLGIKEDFRMRAVSAPDHYPDLLGTLPAGARWLRSGKELDFIHVFSSRGADLRRKLPGLKNALALNGTLWISWPKGSSSIETDINREMVRELGLGVGLVDVKVAAVDEDWSGLKFVYRLKDRS